MRDADIAFKLPRLVDQLSRYNFDHAFFEARAVEPLRCFIVFNTRSIEIGQNELHQSLMAKTKSSTDPYLRDLDQVIMWITSGKDVAENKADIVDYFTKQGATRVLAQERYEDMLIFAYGDFTISPIAFKLAVGFQLAELKGFETFDFRIENLDAFSLKMEEHG